MLTDSLIPRRALLLDLDNVSRVPLDRRISALTMMTDAAKEVDLVYAAARDDNFDFWNVSCRRMGFTIVMAPTIPDGSDLVLSKTARCFALLGVEEFVIVSSDHHFTRLPGTVHVVYQAKQAASVHLRRRAASMTALDFYGDNPFVHPGDQVLHLRDYDEAACLEAAYARQRKPRKNANPLSIAT